MNPNDEYKKVVHDLENLADYLDICKGKVWLWHVRKGIFHSCYSPCHEYPSNRIDEFIKQYKPKLVIRYNDLMHTLRMIYYDKEDNIFIKKFEIIIPQ